MPYGNRSMGEDVERLLMLPVCREIFLKTDNHIEGLFFADLLKVSSLLPHH